RRIRRAMARIVEINQEFHRIIYEAARNSYLPLLLQRVVQLPLVYRAVQLYGDPGLNISLSHHRELARSLRDRNPTWAEAVMTAHIMHGRAALLAYLHAPDPQADPGAPAPNSPGEPRSGRCFVYILTSPVEAGSLDDWPATLVYKPAGPPGSTANTQ